MKLLLMLVFALPLVAQNLVLVMPYQPALVKWLQRNADTDAKQVETPSGLEFGEPAVEDASASPRRMAFSYSFSEVDEQGKDSDLTWLGKRLLQVATNRGICASSDKAGACSQKVKAYVEVRRDGTLPADWAYPADSEKGKAQAAAKAAKP